VSHFVKQGIRSYQKTHSPIVAALLSAVWCGLGHLYAGRYLMGLLLAALYLVSLLSTILFYGYILTPLLWLIGILSAAYAARRPLPASARVRQMRISIALLAVFALASVARAVWLRQSQKEVRPVALRASSAASERGVLSAEAAAHLEYLLDLALRPVDDWSGWSSVDQFGQTALRYQIAFVGYALAQAQYLKLPAYAGPIRQALDNLIQRMLDKRVWGYWRVENLWGNWDANPDPVAKDNVMYSGHLANLIGLYELLFADPKYDQPGAVRFRWSDTKIFGYDHLSLVQRLYEQIRDNPYHAIPCEPHQVFLMCNDHAMLSLLLADRVHGTQFSSVVPSFTASAQKIFAGPNNQLRYPYYEHLGVTLPLTLAVGNAWSLAFAHPFAADWTERLYPGFVRRFVRWREDGSASVPGTIFEFMDIGNYRPFGLSGTAFSLVLAKEMGDESLVEALLSTLERKGGPRVEDGKRWFTKASLLLNAVITLGLVNEAHGLRRLYASAPDSLRWQQPHLLSVDGSVQVRSARFNQRQKSLVFTLAAVPDDDVEATIAIAGFEAGQRLRVTVVEDGANGSPSGWQLQADSEGMARWSTTIGAERRFLIRAEES
jgi:TM2 domain-containing membrane protein YozV